MLLVVLVRVGLRRPAHAVVVPVAAPALLLSAVTAGEQLLGWTA